MKVAYVVQVYEEGLDPQELIERYYSTRYTIRALAQLAEVYVFYRFDRDDSIEFEGAKYYFIKDKLPHILRHRHIARSFSNKVSDLCQRLDIDIIHSQSQNAAIFHWFLRKKNISIPYIVQDHGAPASIKHAWLKRNLLRDVNGLLMSAEGMEAEWVSEQIFTQEECFFVMEASSEFGDQPTEDDLTLEGTPVFLWVGNLDANKDPMTVLQSFSNLLDVEESARLHMIFKQTGLLERVKAFIDSDPLLNDGVTLVGYVERSEISKYYRAADFIISSSYKEGSGYSVMEAMSCGARPIVTNIPSFIQLTNNGTVGALFNPGDVRELSRVMREECKKKAYVNRGAISDFFDLHFSYDKIAHQLFDIYGQVIDRWKAKQ